jgi:hypothetical protein
MYIDGILIKIQLADGQVRSDGGVLYAFIIDNANNIINGIIQPIESSCRLVIDHRPAETVNADTKEI